MFSEIIKQVFLCTGSSKCQMYTHWVAAKKVVATGLRYEVWSPTSSVLLLQTCLSSQSSQGCGRSLRPGQRWGIVSPLFFLPPSSHGLVGRSSSGGPGVSGGGRLTAVKWHEGEGGVSIRIKAWLESLPSPVGSEAIPLRRKS